MTKRIGKATRLRCTIWTRKSTEEGLDQAFNSLDAQYEACVAYFSSQVSLGWKILPDRFDDGGVSGGAMEGPALRRLLALIEADRIDVVVVYKIDRLTRSLTDFANMVDLFDQHQISFVSVTQQFNTTTSMGRLTLNVLLSFAQFEREVTAERIRDKIAASRKKGFWVGGPVLLGYRTRDKVLVPDPETVLTVRTIFERYLDLGSLRLLSQNLQAHPLPGLPHDKPISRGRLSALLSNPVYIGKARHRGQVYDGVHEAFVDTKLFDRVQAQLKTHAPRRRALENIGGAHLLTGLVVDEHGDRLSPVHTSKGGKRYRYYVSKPKAENGGDATPRWRLPASELERVVDEELCSLLSNGAGLSRVLGADIQPDELGAIVQRAGEIAETFPSKGRADRQAFVHAMILNIQIAPTSLRIDFKRGALREVLRADGLSVADTKDPNEVLTIERTLSIKRLGHEAKIIVEGSTATKAEPDPGLIALLAKAHHAFNFLTNGTGRSVQDVASHLQADRSDISRVLPFVFLSPPIVDSIFNGRHPPALTARLLARANDLPQIWDDQDAFFGVHRA